MRCDVGCFGAGDIGKHFPDTDSRYQNISSRTLLEHVVVLLAEHNYSLSNADMTIVAE